MFSSDLRAVSFSPDGSFLATVCDDQSLYLVSNAFRVSCLISVALFITCIFFIVHAQFNSDTAECLSKCALKVKPTHVAWHPRQATLLAVAHEDKSAVPTFVKFVTIR